MRPHLLPLTAIGIGLLAITACADTAPEQAVAAGGGPAAAAEATSTFATATATATATPTQTPIPPVPTPTPRPVIIVPPATAGSPTLVAGAPKPPEITAKAAVVLDEVSATVLFDKDAHAQLPPASLTKIASAILVIERGHLDVEVTNEVDSRVMTGSSVMGLLPGDIFTVRDLLYGLMLPSGNDAALALGRATSGSDARFVQEMNELARRLGLWDTQFANPHGLSSRGHYSSAYDLAMLSRYAMTLPEFREVAGATKVTVDGSRTIEMRNSNTFVGSYRGADGVKIGYTRSAGNTLVASAVRDGRRLYAVVLNSTDRNNDAAKLLDWAFASYRWAGQ